MNAVKTIPSNCYYRKEPLSDHKVTPQVLGPVGQRIRSVRGFTSLTRKAFCQKHNISEATLKAWELSVTTIREASLSRFLEALRAEGIVCSKGWIREGIGSPPYKFNSNISSAEAQAEEHGNILAEVNFFLKNNKNAVVFQIPDESMAPFYNAEDYIGAILIQNASTIKNDCFYLVTLKSGEKGVRNLFYDGNRYLVSKTNPLFQKGSLSLDKKEIETLHQIVWHRKSAPKK